METRRFANGAGTRDAYTFPHREEIRTDKMAPRRKSVQTSRRSLNGVCYKENNYLCCLNDYQTRVRRRESLRHARSHAVSPKRSIVRGRRDRRVRWLAFKGHFASRPVDTLSSPPDSRRFDGRWIPRGTLLVGEHVIRIGYAGQIYETARISRI